MRILNRPEPAQSELYEFDALGALLDHEVVYYSYGNRGWEYGIVTSPGGKLMSIYNELSANGVPSVTYVTQWGVRSSLRFRLARPEEYAVLEFSYGYQPRLVLTAA